MKPQIVRKFTLKLPAHSVLPYFTEHSHIVVASDNLGGKNVADNLGEHT